jgi:RNA polymerase sigma-70 factor (ECF subfamily)
MDLTRLIQATLDCLPGHYGDVLEWKYVDGLSVDEIAARLAVGPKAAESALTRARNAFREAMQAIGGATDYLPESILKA